jgi:hypothetical protein
MNKRVLLSVCFLLVIVILAFAKPARSITGFEHSIYSDRRTAINWSETMIFPLQGSYTLIPELFGSYTDDYSLLGSALGLAYNLPGQIYGQSRYSLKMYFEDSSAGGTSITSLFHSLATEVTYETGTWFVSPALEFKVSGEYTGLMIAPYLRLYPGGWGYFFVKYFGSVAMDQDELIFNNTLWTGLDLKVHPRHSLAVEGTAGTVNEAGIDGFEYTGTLGINSIVTEKTVLKYRFHFSYGESEGDPYKKIKNGLVLDLRF